MALQSSQRLPELLFYTKKSYRILQLQFYKGTHPPPSTYNLHVHNYTTVHPENSPSRIQFYMQKTKSSSSTTTTTYRGQRDLHSRFQKRNSTHRRQGDLLEMHPCVTRTFQAFQPQDLPKALQSLQTFQTFQSFQSFQTFQTFQSFFPDIPVIPDIPVVPDIPVIPDIPDIPVIHDLPAFPGNSTSSSISRDSNPFQHSPIRMHILQCSTNSTVRLVSTENSTEYQLSNYKHSTNIHSSKKGRCCDIGQTCIGKDVKMTYSPE